MKNSIDQRFVTKRLSHAVTGALAILCGAPLLASAQGSDENVTQIMRPTNFVEIGVNNVNTPGETGSTKFGEYNGLNRNGGSLIGNFSIKGGGAYDRGDSAMRWEATGVDVGTSARELGFKAADQGTWNFGLGYNELRHYTAGPFVTPLQGSAGGNVFTLPKVFGSVSSTAPSARLLTPVQQSYMRQVDDLYSGRKNLTINAGYIFDNQWSVTAEYGHLKQTGAKLQMGAGMQQVTVANNGAAGTIGGATFVGETPMALMMPTEYTTQTLKLALNWKGDKGHATASYYGSYFRDAYNSMFWDSPVSNLANGTQFTGGHTGNVNQLSTAPDNMFSQLNFTGGYALRPATKLTANYSYGRNTQNDAYAYDPALLSNGIAPRTSLNGLVNTTNLSFKLVDSSIKDLTLSGSFRYNKRDNRSPSDVYNFFDIGHNTLRQIANLPYSHRKSQLEFAADYRIDKNQKLTLSVEDELMARWCNAFARTSATGNNPFGVTNCAVYPNSEDKKLNVTYNVTTSGGSTYKAGFVAAERRTAEDHTAMGPIGVTSVSTGGLAYMNNGDTPGYKPWFEAQRKQRGIKLGASWPTTEQLTITTDGQYTHEYYPSSEYGVQRGDTVFFNLDGTYAVSEDTSMSAYGSWHMRTRSMHDNANSVGLKQEWNQELKDYETVLGMTAKFNRLMKNKLDVVADFSVSLGRVTNFTQILYSSTATNMNNCDISNNLTCGYTPEINERAIRFKLSGDYKLDKESTVRLAYLYQNLSSNDYIYNIYQYSATPNSMMPTNQQAPRYSVHGLGASYIYTFK